MRDCCISPLHECTDTGAERRESGILVYEQTSDAVLYHVTLLLDYYYTFFSDF